MKQWKYMWAKMYNIKLHLFFLINIETGSILTANLPDQKGGRFRFNLHLWALSKWIKHIYCFTFPFVCWIYILMILFSHALGYVYLIVNLKQYMAETQSVASALCFQPPMLSIIKNEYAFYSLIHTLTYVNMKAFIHQYRLFYYYFYFVCVLFFSFTQ